MFTGLITAVGTVVDARRSPDGLEIEIDAPFDDLDAGESIAVAGACLSVEVVTASGFVVHVIETSIGRTFFADSAPGDRVNLERSVRVGDRLGGHLVQGHVDGVGRVTEVSRQGDAVLVDISIPAEIERLTIPLGSIAVDGVSLTVNAIPGPGTVQISLIPITLQHTTLGALAPGDAVHLEGDMIGKYVAALMAPWSQRNSEAGAPGGD
jgi:riboflavin synthase